MTNLTKQESVVNAVTQAAQKALLYEVSCYPKPGLVDPIDCGSHDDMDFFTFVDSAVVLYPFFSSFINEGYRNRNLSATKLFSMIRPIGIEAEKRMMDVTFYVNTHKGAIFSLGVLLSAYGSLMNDYEYAVPFEKLFEKVKEMLSRLLDDFSTSKEKPESEWSFGERLYHNFGIEGIRGEAYRGYKTVTNIALPFYLNSKLALNDKLIDTLLMILFWTEDSNLIKRSNDVTIHQKIKVVVDEYFCLGGISTVKGKEYLIKINEVFKENHWSIGGSADLLILTIFLADLIEKRLVVY